MIDIKRNKILYNNDGNEKKRKMIKNDRYDKKKN